MGPLPKTLLDIVRKVLSRGVLNFIKTPEYTRKPVLKLRQCEIAPKIPQHLLLNVLQNQLLQFSLQSRN